jgi:hypothetical protein
MESLTPAASTETFVETSKNKLTSWETTVTVERTPATIEDLDWSARWFETVGAQVAKVERVKVTRKTDTSTPYTETGFEVTFLCGAKGWITVYGGAQGAELNALVVGGKGYLHGLAVWKKRSYTVGNCVPWFTAQMGARKRLNANTAPKCCAAELYARAAGKPWGYEAMKVA